MNPSASEPSGWAGQDRGQLRIGSLSLGGRALLAPMAGVTDLGMRRAAQRFGASMTVSEMVVGHHLARGEAASLARAAGAGLDPHVVQVAGCRPDALADGARAAADAGAVAVDINMGCPAKKVTGGLAGSALMRDLDAAVGLIRATVAAVRVPVTVKMRLGWDRASLNAPELARRAEAEGVAAVTVHGRTREQFYEGCADPGAVAAVKRAVSIPVVVNGDCGSVAAARAMLAASGADAVMVGRAAIGRPWLVGEIAAALRGEAWVLPPLSERRAAALAHLDALLDAFGPRQGNRHARKHLVAYAVHRAVELRSDRGTSEACAALRAAMATSDDHRATRRMLARLFDLTLGAELAA